MTLRLIPVWGEPSRCSHFVLKVVVGGVWAVAGDFTIARILHRHNVDLHKFDGDGMNALHRACRGGQVRLPRRGLGIVGVLCTHAVLLLLLSSQVEFMEYLIKEHDFDVDCRSKDSPGRKGQTAMEMVRRRFRRRVPRPPPSPLLSIPFLRSHAPPIVIFCSAPCCMVISSTGLVDGCNAGR